MSASLRLDVDLQPEWRNVYRAHEAVGLLALGAYGDVDLRDAIAMVSAELLENAIKYAPPQTGVSLSIRAVHSSITVAVTNVVVAAELVKKLEDRVRWLQGFATAKAAYTAAIERALSSPDDDGGLGIARIVYEAGCAIACDTSDPGRLTVRASMGPAT